MKLWQQVGAILAATAPLIAALVFYDGLVTEQEARATNGRQDEVIQRVQEQTLSTFTAQRLLILQLVTESTIRQITHELTILREKLVLLQDDPEIPQQKRDRDIWWVQYEIGLRETELIESKKDLKRYKALRP